jgi:excisionase family DNA binding protein
MARINQALTSGTSPPRSQTIDEFAAYLSVAPLTVRREIKRGNLGAVHVGRSVRITPANVAAYLKKRSA